MEESDSSDEADLTNFDMLLDNVQYGHDASPLADLDNTQTVDDTVTKSDSDDESQLDEEDDSKSNEDNKSDRDNRPIGSKLEGADNDVTKLDGANRPI